MQDKEKLEKLKAYYSNERTLLSYIRTSTSVLVLAVALLKFFNAKYIVYLGFFILSIGILILILGIHRYFQEKSTIRQTLKNTR